MPIAGIIALIEGVVSAVPQAVSAFNAFKAMSAAGIEPTADQWNAAIANIDAANAAVQQATPPT